jgi:hypothetical protein
VPFAAAELDIGCASYSGETSHRTTSRQVV